MERVSLHFIPLQVLHDIADSPQGGDAGRLAAFVQLVPKMPNIHVHGVGIDVVILAPHQVHDSFPGKSLVLVGHKAVEQLVLCLGEGKLLIGKGNSTGLGVQGDGTKAQDFWSGIQARLKAGPFPLH